MLVNSFNLSQSFNYKHYLFYKKRFKTWINCFCIRTLYCVIEKSRENKKMMTFDEAFTKKRRIFAKAIKWDYNFATFRGFAFCKKIVEFLHNLFQKTVL